MLRHFKRKLFVALAPLLCVLGVVLPVAPAQAVAANNCYITAARWGLVWKTAPYRISIHSDVECNGLVDMVSIQGSIWRSRWWGNEKVASETSVRYNTNLAYIDTTYKCLNGNSYYDYFAIGRVTIYWVTGGVTTKETPPTNSVYFGCG